jgi:hypothetical protein
MLLTAIAFNLKKLLKYQPQRQASLAMALPKPPIIAVLRTVYTYEHCRAGFRPSQLGRNRPNKGGLQPALFGWGVH